MSRAKTDDVVAVLVRFPESLLRRVDEMAAFAGVGRAELIRIIVALELSNTKGEGR